MMWLRILVPEQVALAHAISNANWPLRSLAANILRILAGGGKDDELHSQLTEAVKALNAYESEVVSKYGRLGNPVATILQFEADEESTRQRILRGALQQVAGLIVNDHLRASQGERKITEGIEGIILRREMRRDPRHEKWRKKIAEAARQTTKRKPRDPMG
jgi:hypothetical protein